MTWFRWWHRYVRMVTKPKPQHVAEKWYKKLSVLYMFFAWNAAGLVIYKMVEASRFKTLTEEQKQGLSKGQQLALEMGKPNAKVITMHNFNVEVKEPVTLKDLS